MKLLFVPDAAPKPIQRQAINRHIHHYVKARKFKRHSLTRLLPGKEWCPSSDLLRL